MISDLPGVETLSLPTILREMSVHILSLRSRRQNRAWGGASAEPQEYGVSTHQAREVGGSFLSCAISSSLRLGQWLSPASQACAINPDRTWGSATLHPRLYSAARIRGLRTRQNVGKDKGLKPTAKFKAPLTRRRPMNKTLKAIMANCT